MFLSNTLALFRAPPTPPPLHVPAVASSPSPAASSSPTNAPQPSIPREPTYYFPDSPHSPSLTNPSPASSRAAVQKKQLVPKAIARCSATPPPPPTAPRPPAAATTQPTTKPARPAAEESAGGGRGRGGIQQQRPALPNRIQHLPGLEEIRKRYPWNAIVFPAAPSPTQKTPKIIIMLKDGSSPRRTAVHTPPSSPAPTTPQHHPSPRTPVRGSVLSYFASPAGQKFLDSLERETKLKKEKEEKKQKRDKRPPPSRPSRPDFGAIASSTSTTPTTSAGAVDDRATHEPSLGKSEGIGRKSRGSSDAAIPSGRSPKPEECQEQEELARSREKHVRHASAGHVATSVWSEQGCSQLPERHHITAAAAGAARETAGDGAELADVFDREGADTPIRSRLSGRDPLHLKESFDQLLLDIKHDQKTSEMGLGRLEFGGTFRLFPSAGPVKKERAKKPAAPAPGRVQPTVSEHGIIPQPLPPQSQVALVTDGSQNPADVDQRGLPSGSSVVLIIDQQWDVRFHEPTAAATKGPEAVSSPSRPRRRNPLGDVVRLRWSVFHPEYTEKSEFTFQPSQLARPEPKRKLSSAMLEQKPKRTRDGDAAGPVFNEKQPVASEVAAEEPSAGPSVVPVAAIKESPTPGDLDSESIQQLPTPPSEIESEPSQPESSEDEAPESEEAAASDEVEIARQQPSPPVSRVMSPIPLEWNAEEEAAIKAAIREAMGEQDRSEEDPDAEFLAMDLSTLPPLPASPVLEAVQAEEAGEVAIDLSTLPPLPESPVLEAVQAEEAGEVAIDLSTLPPLPLSPVLEAVQAEEAEAEEAGEVAIDLSTLPPLPLSPVLEAVQAEKAGEVAVDLSALPPLPNSPLVEAAKIEEQEPAPDSIQLDTTFNSDAKPIKSPQMPSPPQSAPATPPMTPGKEEAMKMVPWMPLTPPETPLSMRHGQERVVEFNVAIPLFPPTPSSVLDSPALFRGKDKQTDDSPSHYFIPAPPSPPSPSHSTLDSPLSSRMRRIGETIKEEEEEEQEEQQEDFPAVVAEKVTEVEDDESDVEEIIRSPPSGYPSPPSSPMPTAVVDSPSKGRELTRVPSLSFVHTPPASILDVPTHDANEDSRTPSSPEPKGKEKDLAPEKPSYPSPVLEQDEEQDLADEEFIRRTPWAIADDIFTNLDPCHYTYTYNSRPPTPASSNITLSRRWSRASYNTALTTPPATRPGSAAGSYHKHLVHDDHSLRRTDSVASSIRRELQARRKPLIASPERPALRWSISMPLIREQWAIRQSFVVSPAEKNFVGAKAEYEEYDVHVPGTIQLLPATRGVIVTPPRIERRRRQRSSAVAGPHRRKIKSLVVYSPDDQLEGVGSLFGELREVDDEIVAAERIVEVVETVGEKEGVPETGPREQEEAMEVLKEKKKGLLKRIKIRASNIKEKVKSRVGSKKAKSAAVAV